MPKEKQEDPITRESLLRQFQVKFRPTGTWKTFKNIASGEADYQMAIAEERNVSPSTVNEQIGVLLDRGWIGIKSIGKGKGKPIHYGVTKRGHNLLEDVIKKLKDGRKKIIEKIDELEKIEEGWEKQILYRRKLEEVI